MQNSNNDNKKLQQLFRKNITFLFFFILFYGEKWHGHVSEGFTIFYDINIRK